MYKVFYQDRIIYLTEDFTSNFHNNYGLFYKFYNSDELKDLLKLFSYVTSIKKLYVFHNKLDQLFQQFSNCFVNITAAGGVVTNSEGKVLIIKRRGKWDLPKGKTEKGENIEHTALREVTEETGIQNLEIVKPLIITYHIYSSGNKQMLKKNVWFDMRSSSNEALVPQSEEEISEAIWFNTEDLSLILGNTYLSIIDILKEKKLLPF
ncbi:MAG: NUDIX domain-containing protein [Bacteroidota bacterium]|nr:NUDIX domain-containing protein [Bacteroidota bacterium]